MIKTTDVMFDETQVQKGGPVNLPPHFNSVLSTKTPQIPEIILFEVELQGVNDKLENDEGDNIDHSHIRLSSKVKLLQSAFSYCNFFRIAYRSHRLYYRFF